jgi:hypothetical protein
MLYLHSRCLHAAMLKLLSARTNLPLDRSFYIYMLIIQKKCVLSNRINIISFQSSTFLSIELNAI